MKKNLVKKITTFAVIGMMAVSALVGCSKTETASPGGSKGSDGIKIAMLPKFKGENYFDACKVGAQEDARDLFINQITAESAAKGLVDAAAGDLKEKGYGDSKPANIVLVSSTETDAN